MAKLAQCGYRGVSIMIWTTAIDNPSIAFNKVSMASSSKFQNSFKKNSKQNFNHLSDKLAIVVRHGDGERPLEGHILM